LESTKKGFTFATAFRFEKMDGRLTDSVARSAKSKQGSEKFFKNFSRKIWRVRKKVLPLQPLSETSLKANVQEKKFEGTTFFEDIEQQSFILSFQ